MRGEGGELGFDGLRVADVGKECGEDGKACGCGGDGQAGLRHHGQQRGGLEGDGFAAGVGAADDELAGLGREFERERDNMASGRAQVLFEQRMAGRVESQKIGSDGRRDAIVVAGKAGAGLQAVDQREHARAFDEGMRIAADLAGERDEDAMDLGLLFFDEADEFVVLLDGFEGLDVDGLAGRTGAVDDAARRGA